MTPSPNKRSSDMLSNISPYASKFPRFDGCGNYFRDENLKSYHTQALIMITGMAEVPDVIPMLFSKYQEVTKHLNQTTLDVGESFHPVPKAFWSIPDPWVCGFVVDKTDLTAEDCGAMLRVESKSVHRLFLGITQLAAKHAMEGDVLHKGVCYHVCTHRADEVGHRYAKVKENGFYAGSVVDMWNGGAYHNEFNASGQLVKITHRLTGAEAGINPLQYLISYPGWDLIDNYSDMAAEWKFGQRPGTKLHTFFAKSPPVGPHAQRHFAGAKDRSWIQFLQNMKQEFELARDAASGSGGRTVVAEVVVAAHKEMKREVVTKLQEASKLALKKTAEKRVVPKAVAPAPVAKAGAEPKAKAAAKAKAGSSGSGELFK